jgi:hypothetical protein
VSRHSARQGQTVEGEFMGPHENLGSRGGICDAIKGVNDLAFTERLVYPTGAIPVAS